MATTVRELVRLERFLQGAIADWHKLDDEVRIGQRKRHRAVEQLDWLMQCADNLRNALDAMA